jgi:anti-sigma factor RsiW
VSREDSQDHMDELAAGYVLGNLSPEEAEVLQQYVRHNPEFAIEIDRLYDTLGVMPYALPEADEPINLRRQLFAMIAEATPLSNPSTTPIVTPSDSDRPVLATSPHPRSPVQPNRTPLCLWIAGWATVTAMLCGLMGWQTHRELMATRSALSAARDQVSTLEATVKAQIADNTPILQPDATLARLWQFDRLIEDHRRAIQGLGHGHTFQTSKIIEIVQQFQDDFEFAPALPVLNDPGVQLISGSFCELGQIPGFRFSYQTKDGRKLSLYQVGTPSDPLLLPKTNLGRLHVRQVGQPEIILWSHQGFDYALVAEMPREQLETIGSIRYQMVSR